MESRPPAAEAETGDVASWPVAPHEIGEQRRLQRPVHDQAGIAFLACVT